MAKTATRERGEGSSSMPTPRTALVVDLGIAAVTMGTRFAVHHLKGSNRNAAVRRSPPARGQRPVPRVPKPETATQEDENPISLRIQARPGRVPNPKTKKKLWDHMFRASFFLEDIEGKEHCVGVALEADATQLVAEHVGLFPDMKSFMLEAMADEISRLSKELEEAKAAAEQMMVAAAAVGAGPEEAREAALAQDRVKALVHDKYVADAANLLMDRAMEAVRESMEEATETKRIATEWKGAVFDAGVKDKIDYNAYAQALAELAAAKKLLPKAKAAADEAQGQLAAAEAERAVKGTAAQEAAPKLSPAIVTVAKLFAALVCAKAEG